MSQASIILIGPSNAGKSSLIKPLAEALNYRPIDLDELRWNYYNEIGYDAEKAKQIRQEGGMKALAAYWKPFDIYGIERILKDYPERTVIAFGAGHSIYEDEEHIHRANEALSKFSLVILLVPSPDKDESYTILRQRLAHAEPEMKEEMLDALMEINRSFIEHPSNLRLARHTVYTAGKTIEESATEILKLILPHP
jgi:shikimate kinase